MSERPHDLTPEKHALYVHARQIIGRPGGEHWDLAHRYLMDHSWREEEVRQAVDAPEDVEWFTRVLALEYHGLAGFRFYEVPEGSGAYGFWDEGGRWRDQPHTAAGTQERGEMLSSHGTTCLIRLPVRAFSSDIGPQAQPVIWGSSVPIYAGGSPEPVRLREMA
jgi:hypothetical protein